ncbi:hypothetical protein [Clostridium faecium]|uniref:Uncharacterized protein n=1 Tax=Clostridium faecium TaxID=2762223 RepID=A0ABR8YP97_9CLOT|nr:hypothetical protein [Clostridium faecium]MBD8045848.1 hypothetical protein [Clostridium faecium]
MKWTDYMIFAIILITSISLPLKIKQEKMLKSEELKIIYNEAVDNAVKDAVKTLLEPADNESMEILADGKKINFKKTNLNLDKALWRFYQTMFLNLNIENDYMMQEAIKSKIPIKLAVGYDGYFINSWQEIKEGNKLKEVWHPKTPYIYFDTKNNLSISLTLDNTIYIIGEDGEKEEYKAEDLLGKYNNILFSQDIEKFHEVRKQIIIESIQKDLERYSSLNNQIAIKNGWGYTLQLPIIDERAINDISFMAFLQGKPLNGIDLYNNYGLGIARAVRESYIYTNVGDKYYHNKNCNKSTNYDSIFDSEKEAAKAGYHPHDCIFQNNSK